MAIVGAAKLAGNYGNGKGRALRGGKLSKLTEDFKDDPPTRSKKPKSKKRKVVAAALMEKPKKGGRRMPEPMSDQDFGVR